MYKPSFNCETLKNFTPAYTVSDLNICLVPNAQDIPQKLISSSVWLCHFTAAHDVSL